MFSEAPSITIENPLYSFFQIAHSLKIGGLFEALNR
jgi:hypothetical protein